MTKLDDALFLLKKDEVTSALRSISLSNDYVWARDTVLAALSIPVPPPPIPVPLPVITTQGEFSKALDAAKGGETILLGAGTFSLPNRLFSSEVTVRGGPDTIYTPGKVSGSNIRLIGGKVKGGTGDTVIVSDSKNITFDGLEVFGTSNGGKAFFGRNVTNLKIVRCNIHNFRDGVVIWTGDELYIEDSHFSRMGSDCIDPSNVIGVYVRRNTCRDAFHVSLAHPDFVQLGTAPCTNVFIEDNDIDADTMGIDDFGCTGPNKNVYLRRNKFRSNSYENSFVLKMTGTTGEATDNVILTGGKRPLYSFTGLKKSGNTLDGQPI